MEKKNNKKNNKPEILATVTLEYKAPKQEKGLRFLYVYMYFTEHRHQLIDVKFGCKIILTKILKGGCEEKRGGGGEGRCMHRISYPFTHED